MNLTLEMYALVDYLLSRIMDEIDSTDPKSDPSFKFFPIVQLTQQMIQLVQLHFQHCLVRDTVVNSCFRCPWCLNLLPFIETWFFTRTSSYRRSSPR